MCRPAHRADGFTREEEDTPALSGPGFHRRLLQYFHRQRAAKHHALHSGRLQIFDWEKFGKARGQVMQDTNEQEKEAAHFN